MIYYTDFFPSSKMYQILRFFKSKYFNNTMQKYLCIETTFITQQECIIIHYILSHCFPSSSTYSFKVHHVFFMVASHITGKSLVKARYGSGRYLTKQACSEIVGTGSISRAAACVRCPCAGR